MTSTSLFGPKGSVATDVRWARTPLSRARGVIGRSLSEAEALVIDPCRRVHTFGVRGPLDAVFCDGSLRVVHVETLSPRRWSTRVPAARLCVELAGGRAERCGIVPGVALRLEYAS